METPKPSAHNSGLIQKSDSHPSTPDSYSPTESSHSHSSVDLARTYSSEASQYLSDRNLQQSKRAYIKAAECYKAQIPTDTIVAAVNAAGCFRNLGAVCRRLNEYETAILYWRQAEELYSTIQERLISAPTLQSSDSHSDETVCLDQLWLETLQTRAGCCFVRSQFQEAVHCHESCLNLLLQPSPTKTVDGVTFVPLTRAQCHELLVVSMQNLGGLYHSDLERVSDDGLDQMERSLRLLQDNDYDYRSNPRPITETMRYLSEIYSHRGQTDEAVDALQDAMDIELSTSDEPSHEALIAMDKMGLANEQLGHFDKALSCYEKSLLARSRSLGDTDISVAKSLVNVARVMELQDNTEGAMDLYRAAHKIYAMQITACDFDCSKDDVAAILQLIPNLMDQGRFGDARNYLSKCLSIMEQEETLPSDALDKSQIYYDLGRACMGVQDYVRATICLVEAAKTEGNVTEGQVLAMLHQVETLKHEQNNKGPDRPAHSWDVVVDNKQHRGQRVRSASPRFRKPPPPQSVRCRSFDMQESSAMTSFMDSHTESSNHIATQPSSQSTLKTLELQSPSDPWLQEDAFNPALASMWVDSVPSNPSRDMSSLFTSSEFDGGLNTLPPDLLDAQAKLLPLLSQQNSNYSDDFEQNPLSSDFSNQGNSKRRGRGLRRGASPKSGSGGDRSLSSQRKNFFGDAFKSRNKRQGFQTLQEEQARDIPEFSEITTDEESFRNAPVAFVDVNSADDVSQITMRLEDRRSKKRNDQEWWWGVTAEGIGRWFPKSYVDKAVQAADAFLSAKAIHAKSKERAASTAIMGLEEESIENDLSEDKEFASNVGIMTTRTSQEFNVVSPESDRGSSGKLPHHGSLFSSMTPQQQRFNFDGENHEMEISKYKEILGNQRRQLGRSHPEVATTLFTLAILCSREKDMDTSIEYASEALEIQTTNSQVEDTAQTLHFLADLCLHQEKYEQSLSYYAKAMKHETLHYGYYSDDTARNLNYIGTVKLMQNLYRESMESHEEALRILEHSHGEDLKNPLVSETLCLIGSVYYRERNAVGATNASNEDYTTFIEGGMLEVIGRAHEDRGSYKMAIAFFQEKLQWLESKEKNDEIMDDTATTLNGLGMLSARAGLFVEALDYYERARDIHVDLGCGEVHIATTRVLIGAVHFQLGDWNKALNLLQEALGCLLKELGERHETVAATHLQIGTVQSAFFDFDAALESLNGALDIQTSALGSDHPAALRTRREIGNLHLIYESELEIAFEHFNAVLDEQKKLHGDRHPNIAETLHSIGRAYVKQGEYTKALRTLEECYYMRVDFLGYDHPLQASTLHDIAGIHLQRGRLKKALHICDLVLEIRKDALTDRHIDIARALKTKGSCLVAQGNADEGMATLEEALSMAEETVGTTHPIMAEINFEMGVVSLRKCQFEIARSSIQKALDIYRWSSLDDDYGGVKEAQEKLGMISRDEMLCV